MVGKNIGIVLVHGMGNQKRYEFLKDFATRFEEALRQESSEPKPEVLIDKVELYRTPKRTRESSELFGFFGDIPMDHGQRRHLFRPVQIVHKSNVIRLYEAYWADEDLTFSWYEKISYNIWLLTVVWNPIFNWFSDRYTRPPMPFLRVFWDTLLTLVAGSFLQLVEVVAVLFSFVLGRFELFRRFGEMIYEYAGDVKLYVSMREFFYHQTKKEVIQARFDEAMVKAYLENDELHVVAHSLGSVIAFDGLSKHKVHPSKMAPELLRYLRDDAPGLVQGGGKEVEPIDIGAKLKTLITIGSPLDKFYFFWPSRREELLQGKFILRLEGAAGGSQKWVAVEEESELKPEFKWFNVYDLVDPVGAKLDFYGEAPAKKKKGWQLLGFPVPENIPLRHYFRPSQAHTGFFRYKRFMKWLVKVLYTEPAVPREKLEEKSKKAGIVRVLVVAAAVLLSSVIVLWVLEWAVGLGLEFLHQRLVRLKPDLGIIRTVLDWVDRLIVRLIKFFGVDVCGPTEETLWEYTSFIFRLLIEYAKLGFRILIVILIASLPFSWWRNRSTERLHGEHLKRREPVSA